ncbi:alpha/beta fold hydrolase [Rhodobacter sp. KR11]|uniref:alpha/beta fold hydrolase BchO n=1 Tax=Rhodobacter sp. KR11 TaxID=2974588 RepID=UPI0022213589|nr:alpha/beta fold hydrolase BchO [Rhodobacter sp. KR11]MCW1920222.1 alpha/beta fold hydrolase [Rhodobacter sp. KR11]
MTRETPPKNWPQAEFGRRVTLAPHRWWLVERGPKDAPVVLLLHGTGASGHSFRRLADGLQARFRVIIPDLPGQGFSASRAFHAMTLDAMAEDLWRLMDHIGAAPVAVIGHSAGAAIALRLAEMRPLQVVGINAALGSFDGLAAVLFPAIARTLAAAPFAARMASGLWGRPATVARLLAGTGSPLDAEGRGQYLTLVQDPGHVAGTLAMMAGWQLAPLLSRLPALRVPVWLIASAQDRAVPPKVSEDAAALIPGCRYTLLPQGGHLPQEEAQDGLAALILPHLPMAAFAPV